VAFRETNCPNKLVRRSRLPCSLNVLQLVLIQPEIVAQFMDDRKADLFADFGLAGADRFNVSSDKARCDRVLTVG
jgi:hypothetical protein